MEVVCLSADECRLLSTRFAEHGNSHRRMASALEASGADAELRHLHALRRLEARFAIDLGSLCHRFERRDTETTHPLERMVLEHIASWRETEDGGRELWVLVDHVRQVRGLIDEGQLVREPES